LRKLGAGEEVNMANAEKPTRAVSSYDETFDVVVVGYGYAGGIAALEAAKHGARVLLIEKSAVPGGISICSYGAVRSAGDRNLAYKYLSLTNGGRTGDDVVRALSDGMCEMEDYVRDLAKANDAEITTTEEYGKTGANYPMPGYDTFYHTTVVNVPNFRASAFYPSANGAPGGPMHLCIRPEDHHPHADRSVEADLAGGGTRGDGRHDP
jgi:protoporphyrinogen oxidase